MIRGTSEEAPVRLVSAGELPALLLRLASE
jgi:hypothetical protein